MKSFELRENYLQKSAKIKTWNHKINPDIVKCL